MNIPRQPFVGLALMAAIGIVVADYFPIATTNWLLAGAILSALAIAVFSWPKVRSTYLLVGAGFFLLHNFRSGDTSGLRLASDLTERPRVVRAAGVVRSEPKMGTNGLALCRDDG